MARRVADGVWLLNGGLVKPLATNVYLVDDGDVTLVDAGLPYNYPRLDTELADAGYDQTDIDRVLITHYDLDHVGGLARLGEYDGPVFMGEEDVRLVRREWHPQWFHHKGAFHRIARRFFPMERVDLRPVADGEQIGGFTAYHTPGHNPGHTVFVHEEFSVGFLGDLVWGEGPELTPPFWLDSYDMRQLRESIRLLSERAIPFETACMSHGDPITLEGGDALHRLAGRL